MMHIYIKIDILENCKEMQLFCELSVGVGTFEILTLST